MKAEKALPILGKKPGWVMHQEGFGPWRHVLISVLSFSTDGHDTEDEAIKEWNRRVTAIRKKFKNTGAEMHEFWDSMEK